jgi:hypothetical protein
MKTSDDGRNYTLHFFICQHRHRAAFEAAYGKTPTAAQSAKDTVEKTRNQAGFSLHSRPEDASRLRRILNDRDPTGGILAL